MIAPAAKPYTWAFAVGASALFLLVSLLLAGNIDAMFADADALWHLAAGDLMRAESCLTVTDPWSFTTQGYQWLNISWLWDGTLSVIHERWGWHGAAAVNAVIIALAFALIFFTCIRRSNDLIAATLATIGVAFAFTPLLRPLELSYALLALWLLILSSLARGECRARWLLLLPLTMLLWVNVHGGFAAGGLLLLAYFAQALSAREFALARRLFVTGLFCFAAIFCNPLGFGIIEGFLRVMGDAAQPIINEWQPLSLSADGLLTNPLAIAFVLMVPGRRVSALSCERWLAYFWLLMGVLSVRHMPIFAIIAAPIVSSAIQARLAASSGTPNEKAIAAAERFIGFLNRRSVFAASLALCAGVSLWLPSPQAARLYGQAHYAPPSLAPEIHFLQTHYPKARLLTEFYLSDFLVYETRGAIPVFIDSRTQTAYPPEVIGDYIKFLGGAPGWEAMMEKYKLDGAILPNNPKIGMNPRLLDSLSHRKGWKEVFKGPNATIFTYTGK